jgi:23S rRNA (guanosine2251-2'-O)-methyltransferase
MSNDDIIFGKNAVESMLESNRSVNKILICDGIKGAEKIVALAKQKGIVFSFVPKFQIDKISRNSQGIIAYVAQKQYISLDELVKKQNIKNNPSLCILDSITDPHNVGAIARSAYVFGVNGLILPKRNACGINSTVVKTSSGAIEFLDVTQVTNIVSSIEFLKEKGFWIVGADMSGRTCWEYDFSRPIVFVLGNEENGIHHLVKQKCDDILKIPSINKFDSLNVSCAASVLFYEMVKQRIEKNSK